jgi:coenzyme F420-reducing hydrogenase beta subunit
MTWDSYGQRKPAGPEVTKPTRTFARTCPFSPAAANEDVISGALFSGTPHDPHLGHHLATYVGAAAEPPFRERGSSGGMVSWVAAQLLRSGEVDGVLHVVPANDGRLFRYTVSRTEDQLLTGAKSRYYPVDLAEVLAIVRATPGRYAVIGIPCFIKAVNLLRREEPTIAERITHTLGLFCGHMKSARFVDSFAWQLHTAREHVRAVDYRRKDAGRPANWYTAQLTLSDGSERRQDWWHLVDGDWGAGYFMNAACNMCDDVVAETADISFGDAWVEPYSSDGRGTNVVVVRSEAMRRLVADGIASNALALEAVSPEFVRDTQAAGFRHRREGLAYRLTWPRRGVRPIKRVAPSADLPEERKRLYRLRAAIARWSHRIAWAADRLRLPILYMAWAEIALRRYRTAAYGEHERPHLLHRWRHGATKPIPERQ